MQMVKKVTGSLLAVFSLCLVLVNAAFADQAAEALRKHLDSMNSLEGNFTQVMTDANADVHESASGNFMLQRPGKFYWETLDPMPQVLVSNGKTIWLYDPDLETVNVRQFTEDLRQTPALLLSEDIATLRENFSITHKTLASDTQQFVLTPKVSEGLFASLSLVFKQSDLVEFSIEDSLGQVTRCELTNLKRNQPLAEEKFYFQIPTGVEVISN